MLRFETCKQQQVNLKIHFACSTTTNAMVHFILQGPHLPHSNCFQVQIESDAQRAILVRSGNMSLQGIQQTKQVSIVIDSELDTERVFRGYLSLPEAIKSSQLFVCL